MSTARITKIVNEYSDRASIIKKLERDYWDRACDSKLTASLAQKAPKARQLVRYTETTTEESVQSSRNTGERPGLPRTQRNCESTDTLYFPGAKESQLRAYGAPSSRGNGGVASARCSSSGNTQEAQIQSHMKSLRESSHCNSNSSLNQDKTVSARVVEGQLSPPRKPKQRTRPGTSTEGYLNNALVGLHLTEFEKRRKRSGEGHRPPSTLIPKITITTPNSRTTYTQRDDYVVNHDKCSICKKSNEARELKMTSEIERPNKFLKNYTIFKDMQ